MKTNPNDPINPCNLGSFYTDGDGYTHPQKQFSGLTVREYFAAMAMQGLCVPCTPGSHNINNKQEAAHKAQMAVALADALLEELNKSN